MTLSKKEPVLHVNVIDIIWNIYYTRLPYYMYMYDGVHNVLLKITLTPFFLFPRG